ncbi:MAG TPA: DUF2069 domain-containing protein [Caldimonas sp.]|jgi:uncharacterized membrane protein
MDVAAAPTAEVRRTRALAVAATVALIVLGVAWELWLAPTGRGTLAVKVLPLVLALPGLVRLRLYTYRWLSLAIWLYAAEGAARTTTERGTPALLAGAELVLALVIFAACGLHVRARLRAGAAGAAPASALP